MATDASVLLWVALAYFAVVFSVSLWGYRRATSEVEFLAAGHFARVVTSSRAVFCPSFAAGLKRT